MNKNTLALLLVVSLVALPGYAANMAFLKNSVVAELSEQEIDSFKQFIAAQLNTVADGETVEWKSGESAREGKMKVKFSHVMAGIKCRRTVFGLVGENQKREMFKFDVCKVDDKWQIEQTPASLFSDEDWDLMQSRGKQALALKESGEPLVWRNENSGNSGVFVALPVFKKQGKLCRKLAITVSDNKGKSSSGRYAFCQNKDQWQRDFEDEIN